MKIFLTGPGGFVGQRIVQTYPDLVIPSPSLRNLREEEIYRILSDSEADVIIHTAAISSIPECEARPEDSYRANVLLPVSIARAAKGKKLVMFSSDQVYSGSPKEGPYTEADAEPSNIYSVHKLEMEQRVLDIDPDAVLLRAEMMYDWCSQKSNYFLRLLQAEMPPAYSSLQYRGAAYLKEVAEEILKTAELPGGAYNFGSETSKSMYEITREILLYLGRNPEVEEGPARHNLWMDCSKARSGGIQFSEVLDGLKKCADDYHLNTRQV